VPDSQPPRYEAEGSWGYGTKQSWSYYTNPIASSKSHRGSPPVVHAIGISPLIHVADTPSPETGRLPKRRKIGQHNPLAALQQLQQYSSYRDDASSTKNIDPPARGSPSRPSPLMSSSIARPLSLPDLKNTPLGLSTPRLTPQDLESPFQSDDRKRPASLDGKLNLFVSDTSTETCVLYIDQRTPKRRKTDPRRKAEPIARGVGRTQSDGLGNTRFNHRNQADHKTLQSEPAPFVLSASHLHDDASQTTEYRKRKMVLDWVGVPGGRGVRRSRQDEKHPDAPEQGRVYQVRDRDTISPGSSSPEDYNSWEAGVSMEEVRKLQRELGGSGKSMPVFVIKFTLISVCR
jgi:hypothetical protein